MLTNKRFELSPAQLQTYNNWMLEIVSRRLQYPPYDEECADVEVVFSFSNIGREVIARIPSTSDRVVLEQLLTMP